MEKSEKLLNPSKNLVPHIILERKAGYKFLIIKIRSEPPLSHLMQHKLSDMTNAGCFVFDKVRAHSFSCLLYTSDAADE